MTNALTSFEEQLQQAAEPVVVGMRSVVRALAIAIVARGHVLLQGAPGLGKTLLSKTVATVLGGVFKRVQGSFRSDACRHHGRTRLRRRCARFRVAAGSGIRRRIAGRRDQSRGAEDAVGAARSDGRAAGDGRSPATIRCRRTSSWLRRRIRASSKARIPCRSRSWIVSCCASISAIRRATDELQVLDRYGVADAHAASPGAHRVSPESLAAARAAILDVHVAPELSAYILDLAAASRTHAHVSLGLSTRGALALLRAARISAGMRGASFVAPDDVKEVAPWVMSHRLLLSPEAVLEGATEQSVTQRLLEQTAVPR